MSFDKPTDDAQQATQSPELILKIQIINTFLEAEQKYKKLLLAKLKKGDVKRAERNFIPVLSNVYNWLEFDLELDESEIHAKLKIIFDKIDDGGQISSKDIITSYKELRRYGTSCGLLRFANTNENVTEFLE